MDIEDQNKMMIEALKKIKEKSEYYQLLQSKNELPAGCVEIPYWGMGDIAANVLQTLKD